MSSLVIPGGAARSSATAEPRRRGEYDVFKMLDVSAFPRLRGSCSSKRELRLAILFGFDAGSEQLLEEALLDQALDGAVVDDAMEVERLQILRQPRIDLLLDDRLDGGIHHVRHALEDVAFRVKVVDA